MNKQELYKKRRKQLVEALRSKKYKQGRERLRIDDKFCCLGVACDIHRKNTRKKWIGESYLAESNYLPIRVMKYFGFRTFSGKFEDRSLATINDEGSSFDYIAEIIEKEPPGLFTNE